MSAAPSPEAHPDRDLDCDPDDGCVTCGDVAVPVQVLAIDSERELGLCEDEHGRRETVEVALVQPVSIGDELLVHAGTAIARLDTRPAGGRDARGGIRAGSDHRSPSAPSEEGSR